MQEDRAPKFKDDEVPDFVDIKLSTPIEVNGTKVTALRMRQPTLVDQKVAKKYPGDTDAKEMYLFANLCDVTPADLEKLTLRDYNKLSDAFLDFLS